MFDNFLFSLQEHFSVKLYFSLFIKILVWFGCTMSGCLLDYGTLHSKQPVRIKKLSHSPFKNNATVLTLYIEFRILHLQHWILSFSLSLKF